MQNVHLTGSRGRLLGFACTLELQCAKYSYSTTVVPDLIPDGEELTVVDCSTFLDRCVSSAGSLALEVNTRIFKVRAGKAGRKRF